MTLPGLPSPRIRRAGPIAALVLSVVMLTGSAGMAATLESTFPRLSFGPLKQATVADLPARVLLTAEDLTIGSSDLSREIAKLPSSARSQFSKYAFVILENMAARKLLVSEAKTWASKNSVSGGLSEGGLINAFLQSIASRVTVTDEEAAEFYKQNRDMIGSATFEYVKADLKKYLLKEKQQAAVDSYVNSISARHDVRISKAWASGEYKKWKTNPVERVRRSGKPSLVQFVGPGCQACEKMEPVINGVRRKYAGRLNLLSVRIDKEQALAAYYDASSIPLQVFCNRRGEETYRHKGVMDRRAIDQQLEKLGVK